MPASILDTSVLIRYLTNDDPAKADATRAYLESSADRSLLVPDVAIAELAFVLLRVYRRPAERVADAIRATVNHRAIDVPGREIWLDIADDLERGRGPVDAYLLRTAERAGICELITFDEGIHDLEGVQCVRPNAPNVPNGDETDRED